MSVGEMTLDEMTCCLAYFFVEICKEYNKNDLAKGWTGSYNNQVKSIQIIPLLFYSSISYLIFCN